MTITTAGRRRRSGSTVPGWVIALLVAARLVALVALLATHPDAEGSTVGGDARRYEQIATADGVWYRDAAIEYPPGSVVVIEAVHGTTLFDTQRRLALSQLAFDLAAAGALAWGFGRRTASAYLLLGLPFLAVPFLYLRLDLVPVALAAAGLASWRRRHDAMGDVAGGALVALGAVAKLWPAALVGIVVVQRRWRAVAALVGVGAVCGAAWVAVAGVDGALQVVSFRGAKGWQVESLTGIVVHLLDPGRVHVDGGAWRTGILPPGARTALSVLSLATVVVTWRWAARRADDPAILYGVAPTACVLALLVWAPIISPQYVLWLLPFAAVATAAGDRTLGWLIAGAAALSTYSLGTIKAQIDGEAYATWPILVRNVVLVAALCHVLVRLAAGPDPTDAAGSLTTSDGDGTSATARG